jgi:hypothetical protein
MGQVSSPETIRAFKSAFQSASEPEADAAKDKAELDRLRAEAFAERTADLSRRERITQAGILFGLLCLGQVVTAQLFWLGLGIAKTLLFVLLAVATAAIALAVFLQTRQFRWFACAAFLSVSFFIVALTYVRTTDSLKVPPAAMLRNGQTPMLGWFVAQTSDRVYLADARRGPVSHRIVAVPRSQVTDLAIGALVPFDRAHMRAVELATELCAIPRAVPTGDQSSSRPSRLNPKNCSMQEIRRLRRLMAELRMERRDE